MSQTNFTPILLYASNTATSVPSAGNLTNSANGAELAVNTADKRLFTKDGGGSVVELGTNPSSLSLPNQTANGVLYLDGSKVATSGSALTFDGTTLAVSSGGSTPALKLYGAAVSQGQLQFSSTSGYVIQGGPDYTGLVYNVGSSSYQHIWQINGSEGMRLTSTGLGIGTSSPASAYSGAARVAMVSATSTNAASLRVSSANASGELYSAGATTEWGLYSASNSPFSIWTNNNKNLTLDASGNLGLGVTPSAWRASQKAIEIGGTFSGISGGLNTLLYSNVYTDSSNVDRYKANGAALLYGQLSVGNHVWSIAPSGTAGNAISFTQAMTLDASGNLGVGTTSPATRVHIRKDGTANYSEAVWENTNSTAYLAIGVGGSAVAASAVQNNAYVYNVNNSALVFGTNNTERARITSGGDLLVGTTSSTRYQNQRCLVATVPNNGDLAINHSTVNSSGDVYVGFGYNGAAIGSVTQSGTTAVLYNTTSDQRLKTNIVDAPDAAALIDSIQVRSFDWIADGSHQRYGMVAQELAAVAPEAVHTPLDPDEMMAVDYSKLVPMLIKELQSLRARVAALEAQP